MDPTKAGATSGPTRRLVCQHPGCGRAIERGRYSWVHLDGVFSWSPTRTLQAHPAVAPEDSEPEHEVIDATTDDTYGAEVERVGCVCNRWLWDANADPDEIEAAFKAHVKGAANS